MLSCGRGFVRRHDNNALVGMSYRKRCSGLTLKSSDHEPARRFEVFTGSGRRREWLPEEKARIVAESYEAGATVSAVARRYALSPQQLFAWRPRRENLFWLQLPKRNNIRIDIGVG
jgi:transposase